MAHDSEILIKTAREASLIAGEALASCPSFRAGSMWWLVFQADISYCHQSGVEGTLHDKDLRTSVCI